jgi:hypothetical protein
MKNDFKYDRIFAEHDMLFPVRHVEWGDLTVNEITEYNQIMARLRPKYQQLMENIGERVSQKFHYHIHLAKFLDNNN